jgi:pimeloyl-ACP methyl ester carboxylesterase
VEVKTALRFSYYESNPDCKEQIVLLHGLFGALSNFIELADYFGDDYNVVIPILPLYTLEIKDTSIDGFLTYLEEFIEYKGFNGFHLLGNSLGGHIAQLYTLKHQDKVKTMTLTGSSGLFESGMGDGYPKRGDYEYIKRKTAETFYDPKIATKDLVDEVFDIVNDREKALRIIFTAKSALRHNLENQLHAINIPTLLVWGNQDTITPPFVGEKFHELIKNSELVQLDKCGHAPMMEVPEQFNMSLADFLLRNTK